MAFSDEEWVAIVLSLKVAALAVTLSLPLGIAVAYLLSRRDFWGKTLLSGLVTLPLVLPPVVTGYLLLIAFGRKGVFGSALESLGIVLSFRWTGAALAAAVMGFPLLVQAIRISMEAIDGRLEQAARTLGASPFWVFLTVTLPLCLPGIIAGVVIAFARSLGEFGATITFVSAIPGETQTLASAIHTALQDPDGEPQAFRLTLLSIALSMLAIFLSGYVSRLIAVRLGARP
ncbi:molybdate transport system permease protein [Rhizobium sp. SG_E_25_P2]|uniref:molybdate ABC transporter permease subunit n=1 Tax=Rhizobium sp. SG_E_25_P2 TaxID=2879942 RepID=UPI00247433E9|nr:molybdate ABC transporter permease subunit [Rhizobium sp. SG_E_25_P2]MDH6266551.1 molybdate transport system permease protein [Rhizobium sp. SG_E_25_P2]